MAEVVRDDQLPAGVVTAGEAVPIAAASVLLLRDDPLEVLMIRRHELSSFAPNAWVFPGGAVDASDGQLGGGTLLETMRTCAARELFEETGIWLGAALPDAESARGALLAGAIGFGDLFRQSPFDLSRLVWTSRWITPAAVARRFDTYFFLARADRGAMAIVQETEAVEETWISPATAIARHERGEFPIVFPTLKHLEAMAGFATAGALIDSRRNAKIPTTRPRLVIENGQKKIVLP